MADYLRVLNLKIWWFCANRWRTKLITSPLVHVCRVTICTCFFWGVGGGIPGDLNSYLPILEHVHVGIPLWWAEITAKQNICLHVFCQWFPVKWLWSTTLGKYWIRSCFWPVMYGRDLPVGSYGLTWTATVQSAALNIHHNVIWKKSYIVGRSRSRLHKNIECRLIIFCFLLTFLFSFG